MSSVTTEAYVLPGLTPQEVESVVNALKNVLSVFTVDVVAHNSVFNLIAAPAAPETHFYALESVKAVVADAVPKGPETHHFEEGQVRGDATIDRETFDLSYEIEANLPGSGWTKLGKAQGNLKQGPVELPFSVSIFWPLKLWGKVSVQLEGKDVVASWEAHVPLKGTETGRKVVLTL